MKESLKTGVRQSNAGTPPNQGAEFTIIRLCEDYTSSMKHERGCSETTRITYISWLRMFVKWLTENGHDTSGVQSFTAPILRAYFYFLSGRKSNPRRPRTIRSAFYPIRGLGEYLVTHGLLSENPAKTIQLPKKDAARRLTVSDSEIAGILDASARLHPKRKAILAQALLHTLVFSGVRFQELIDLKLQDVSIEDGSLLVAHGKGDKSRMLYPPKECMDMIQAWLDVRGEASHDWLWAENKGRRTGEASVRDILEAVKAIAGFEDRINIKPHSLRHAFASRMMNNGAPLRAIQAALGHSSIVTSAIYLKVSEQDTKQMAQYAGLKPQAPPTPPAVTPQVAKPVPSKASADSYRRQRREPARR